MTKEELQKMRDEKFAQMKESVIAAPFTTFDVLDEACMHLIENFKPNFQDVNARHDFVFYLGNSFVGVDKNDLTPRGLNTTYIYGDIHHFSHELADLMKKDADIRASIFHAVDIFTRNRYKS